MLLVLHSGGEPLPDGQEWLVMLSGTPTVRAISPSNCSRSCRSSRSPFGGVLRLSHCATVKITKRRPNVSLQLTGDLNKEVVVAAALVRHASAFHLPGENVARSWAWALDNSQGHNDVKGVQIPAPLCDAQAIAAKAGCR